MLLYGRGGTVTRSRNKLLEASALSLLGHVALFGIIVRQAQISALAVDADAALWADAAAAAASPTWVDLKSVTELPPPEPEAPPEHLPAGDQARSVTAESAPQLGTTDLRGSPAADSGEGAGRSSSLAFRRDRSTLRSRAADNASDYRISHERTASTASSPQPLRQEPRVGSGDSSRSKRPRPADAVAAGQTLPSDPDGAFDPQPTAPSGSTQQSDTGRDLIRGDGPLDAERGFRRFDVAQHGVAQDAQSARAASNESHPGRFELSAPAASGPGSEGQGPSEAPGAVSRPTSGNAAAVRGAPVEAPRGPDLAMSAAEREYRRALGEIRRRVEKTLRFPKRLALELEQGEAVVYFVLRPDGRIDGAVRVVKSAGFDEFDAEAVGAVKRAAPFPPMSRAFTISMPISFDNPLVR
jgi:TonB family protein